jgi:hypothetical protein
MLIGINEVFVTELQFWRSQLMGRPVLKGRRVEPCRSERFLQFPAA